MGDWVGLIFFVLLVLAAAAGLKLLANPRPRSSEEFERGASEGTTALGAGMNALHELFDPSAAKAREVREQMKEGRYQKKKREGKAGGNADEPDDRIETTGTDTEIQ